MNCRNCGYALWNLPQPRCPECGLEFDPRSYHFEPGTIAFACPHCSHHHGGIGEHHIPANTSSVICQKCGSKFPVSHLRIIPLVSTAQAQAMDVLPWEIRPHVSFTRALGQMLYLASFAPNQLGKRISSRFSLFNALQFAACIYLPSACIHALLIGGFIALLGSFMPALVIFTLGLTAPLLVLVLLALPAHVMLRLTGKTAGPYALTISTLLYAQSPMIGMATPIMGLYMIFLLGPWMIISSILALQYAQKVSPLRAVAAILLPLALWLVYLIVWIYIVSLIA